MTDSLSSRSLRLALESFRRVRKLLGWRYPYWWQYASWRIITGFDIQRRLRRAGGAEAPNQQELMNLRWLLIGRGSSSDLRRSASQEHQQAALFENLVRVFHASHAEIFYVAAPVAARPSELREAVLLARPDVVVIADLVGVGGIGPLGLFRARRFGNWLKQAGLHVIAISWDSADFQAALITRMLCRTQSDTVLALGSGSSELAFMGVRARVIGPLPELAVSLDDFDTEEYHSPWAERPFDVCIPPWGDPDRDLLVGEFLAEAETLGLRVKQLSRVETFQSYLKILGACRAVFVVNAIRSDFFRFRGSFDFPSRHHLVGRNLEAFLANCILLTQDCLWAKDLPQCGILTWQTPADGARQLARALDEGIHSVKSGAEVNDLYQLVSQQTRLAGSLR